MKQRAFQYGLFMTGLIFGLFASAGDFVRTSDGIIVHPDSGFSGGAREVRLIVVTDHIIQVLAMAGKNHSERGSLIINGNRFPSVKFEVIPSGQRVRIKTKILSASVDLHTGAVSFYDPAGKKLLAEKVLGRSLQPAVFEGRSMYSIRQDFVTEPDDAWYGLGQHQDGLMNYRGYQVQLFQNNTEVAVPFLVSKNKYGILWDIYSLTQFGDVRPYQSLNALNIFSDRGEPGWLTASYSNNKNDPSTFVVQRPESDIRYEFLNDSKLFLPKEFKPENGIARWEGSVSSDLDGVHKFRFTYAGYIKVWIKNELVLDRWRQNWNPGSAILDVNMLKGQKYQLRIEWIPYGGESYLSVKWLPPATGAERNSFSFNSEAGMHLDYYFIYGQNMDSVIAGYRKLTGKAVILPKWAFGKWQSRERYKTQNELLEVVAEFRKRKIPLDNIVLDWSYWKEADWGSQDFDESRFPNPDSMINVLHRDYNTRFMISVWPKFYEGTSTFKEFDKKGWLYRRNIADHQRDWIGPGYVSTFYDAFDTAAQKGFWELIYHKLYKKGIDAWWMDASEPDILSNVTPEKRKEQMSPTALGPAALYLNAYPLQNAKGIYEGQRKSNPESRVFILTRSAFAGIQRYAAATWSGDIASRWHDMKLQIAAGVNFSLSGLPYWTMDIGGFAVESRFEKPNEASLEEWRELMTRWYQFGAFVPLFRVHGQYPFREIYNIAPEEHPAYKSMLYYDQLRYRLLPYIYSLAGATYHKDATIMRGLVMDFPGDSISISANDQYLFGPSLLVNPVYTYKERMKQVYLPRGTGWYDLYNGNYFEGGKIIRAEAPFERMPVFVRSGSILPLGPDLQYSSEKQPEEIRLFIYTGNDGSFTLYEDEGTNYNYEKGAYATIPLNWSESKKTLTIGKRKGSYSGMLQRRKFHITWISKNDPAGMDRTGKPHQTVLYEGQAVTLVQH